MCAGLDARGPAHAECVGRREAGAMFEAWRQAGLVDVAAARPRPALDAVVLLRPGDARRARGVDAPLAGIPFLTGSEEGRGPLFDVTQVPFEDRRTPATGFESQGHKVGVPGATSTETVPQAVPLMTVRVGDRIIASLPGRADRRGRAAGQGRGARGAGAAGVKRVVVAGLANEFIQYLTTPEEYDRQHYEGGSTLYGPPSSVLLTQELGALAGRMARGEPAQPAPPVRPANGDQGRRRAVRRRRGIGADRDPADARGSRRVHLARRRARARPAARHAVHHGRAAGARAWRQAHRRPVARRRLAARRRQPLHRDVAGAGGNAGRVVPVQDHCTALPS